MKCNLVLLQSCNIRIFVLEYAHQVKKVMNEIKRSHFYLLETIHQCLLFLTCRTNLLKENLTHDSFVPTIHVAVIVLKRLELEDRLYLENNLPWKHLKYSITAPSAASRRVTIKQPATNPAANTALGPPMAIVRSYLSARSSSTLFAIVAALFCTLSLGLGWTDNLSHLNSPLCWCLLRSGCGSRQKLEGNMLHLRLVAR